MAEPLVHDAAFWTHPTDYIACQSLADAARDAGVELLRAGSARNPGQGANLVVLSCAAFAAKAPTDRQTWRIRIGAHGAQALREHPAKGIEFGREVFASEPRLAGMRWDRKR